MKHILTAAIALAAWSTALPALANEGGLAGYTLKPNLAAPAGASCNNCHSGGAPPTVTLTGPATLTAGQIADYSLVVKTGLSRAAGAVAATDGVVLTPLSGLRDSFGELVPNGGVAVAGGQATFTFRVTAPRSGNTLRLWAVGLAANGNGGPSGDKAAHVLRDITVTGGVIATPDAGTSTGSDAGVDAAPGEADGGATEPPTGSRGSSGSGAPSGPNAPSNSTGADPNGPHAAGGTSSNDTGAGSSAGAGVPQSIARHAAHQGRARRSRLLGAKLVLYRSGCSRNRRVCRHQWRTVSPLAPR